MRLPGLASILRAFSEADNALDALLRVRLAVEGGDHRGACPRPLGDVAVIRIGPEIDAEGDAGLSEALGVAGAAMRV